VENVGGRIVAELEVDLLLSIISDAVQIGIDDAVAEAVGTRDAVTRAECRAELVNFEEAFDELVTCVDFENAIGTCPVLDPRRGSV
jgi:hypothetical protein